MKNDSKIYILSSTNQLTLLYPLKNRSCSCFVFFLLSDPRPLNFEHLLERVDLAPWWRLEICVQLSITYMHGMHGRSLFENEKQRF